MKKKPDLPTLRLPRHWAPTRTGGAHRTRRNELARKAKHRKRPEVISDRG